MIESARARTHTHASVTNSPATTDRPTDSPTDSPTDLPLRPPPTSHQFVARSFDNTVVNETIKCTGGVRTEEEEAANRLFQDLVDGPRHSWWPKPGDSAKWKQPPTRGASTHDKDSQLLSVEEMSTAAAKTEKEVERRFQRLADVDRRALAMHRGGQAGDASLAAAYIDFSAKDPWEWWKSSSKLEGEEEVFALPLTGCIGMPSTPRFKEIYGRGCMMLTATPMPPPMEGKKLVVVKNAGNAEGKGALREVREVDRATDLLVFGADGKL